MLRLCATHVAFCATQIFVATPFDSWFDPARLMIRPCSTHDLTLLESWFDPVRLMIRPCSTNDSTLFDSWFDPVRLMIRPCSTHDSTLFDSWFDPARLMIWPCSTHDSTLFDYSVRSSVLICDGNRTPFDRVGRIMSRTPQPGLLY